jgi:hypothetical protein
VLGSAPANVTVIPERAVPWDSPAATTTVPAIELAFPGCSSWLQQVEANARIKTPPTAELSRHAELLREWRVKAFPPKPCLRFAPQPAAILSFHSRHSVSTQRSLTARDEYLQAAFQRGLMVRAGSNLVVKRWNKSYGASGACIHSPWTRELDNHCGDCLGIFV